MAKERKLAFTYNAPVTLTFALISFIVLVIGWITGGKSTALCFEVYRSPLSFFWFVRLFGHVLGHASLTHFAGNMTLFLLLGPVLEEKYGHAILIEAFCIVAVVSGLVNVIFFSTALLGASGIVFMMIILVSASDLRRGEIPITMILVMVIYLGSELWTMVTSHDNVSQLTHIIGGLCGALIGALINSRHEK
ncbi:MAG: rhomboid family intramembrane serine protease [Eubacterium sp.]|jgi:Uncharacterized membrane protein (homolog of Drosophila rhomboid)|nr:rhomboid family intramembrane serine protease [Eubacterium sp.]